jgi:glycosyltransferase involved in cell wall biosynthesis
MDVSLSPTMFATTDAPAHEVSHARLRVLHLINSFELGGTERQAVELLKRLDHTRFDVRLAAIENKGALYGEIAERYPDVAVFPLNSLANRQAWQQVQALRAHLLRERIDILHAHDFYAGWLGAWATRLTPTKFIVAQRHLRLSDRRVHALGRRVMNRLADRVIVNAEMIREYVLAERLARPAKLAVIRNGLVLGDLASQRAALRRQLLDELNLPDNVLLIGKIANLRPVKGHADLLDAAAHVVSEFPNAHFVLIGAGELRFDLEQQARELGIGRYIHFLGKRENAARYNAAFDLAVLASLHEGMPNAVLEAMAANTAVVATAVGGVREIVTDGETGYTALPANPASLAARIAQALTHDAERQHLAANGCAFVREHFGMQQMVEKTEELYLAVGSWQLAVGSSNQQ